MSNSLPKVSIGIPTWNRKDYLRTALVSAFAQTYPNLEIVVSDNASTDGTGEFLSSIDDSRIRLLRQSENIGGIPNLNECLRNATGELFLLLSDDDILHPDAIAKLAAPFHKSTDSIHSDQFGISWCPCNIIDSAGAAKWSTAPGPPVERSVDLMIALFSGQRGPRLSSVLVRTTDARRAGGYNLQRYNAICDTANWGAVALEYPLTACVPEPLVSYRIHASSHTSSSLVSDWQEWGGHMHHDLLEIVQRQFPQDVKRFERARIPLLANLTTDVLMRSVGSPGWIPRNLREVWRSRRVMLTPYVFRRALADGMKLIRSK